MIFGGLLDTETRPARGCVVLCAALCDAGLGWVGWSVHEGVENGMRIYCNKVSYTTSSDCPSYLVRGVGLVVGVCVCVCVCVLGARDTGGGE